MFIFLAPVYVYFSRLCLSFLFMFIFLAHVYVYLSRSCLCLSFSFMFMFIFLVHVYVYFSRLYLCLSFSFMFITSVFRFLLTDLQRRNEQAIPLAAGMAFYLFICCLHPLSHLTTQRTSKRAIKQANTRANINRQTDRQNRTDLGKCTHSRLTDKQANYCLPPPPLPTQQTDKLTPTQPKTMIVFHF